MSSKLHLGSVMMVALLWLMVSLGTSWVLAEEQKKEESGDVQERAIKQGANVEEGKCEVVSVGNYYCKINGKCYYCTKETNPDPNKDCYKETTCDPAITRPGLKGTVRPPIGTNAPILRRGVEGEQPAEPAAPTEKGK